MRTFPAEIDAAIAARTVLPREFLELAVKNRSTGATVYERLWSDKGSVTAEVVDPDLGTTPLLTFTGAGGLVSIEGVQRVADLSVVEASIRLLAHGVDTDRILRTYDASQAPVRLWRGFLDASTRRLVAPAEVRFLGFVDDVELPVGTEGAEAWATLKCKSHSQEMTRSNTATRSDADQRLRSATDNFFASAGSIADDVFHWGAVRGSVAAETKRGLPPGTILP